MTRSDLPDNTQLYDKVLGVLVGSAAGDAMGAPTEMWSRDQIQAEFGFIDSLTDHVREPSPEGVWEYNLHKGGTTDDTRWKALMSEFFYGSSYDEKLDRRDFARHILQTYDGYTKDLQKLKGRDSEPYENALNKMLWLKEWAVVSEAYVEKGPDAHYDALSQFYGGEMVCAGMLFAPSVGLYYPSEPQKAYEACYDINLFDLGYARDISGLTASLVAASMDTAASPESVMSVLKDVDPHHYFKGRLIGRTAYTLYRQAQSIVFQANSLDVDEYLKDPPVKLSLPLDTKSDSIRYARWSFAYDVLDKLTRMYPFHPAEIHLVNLTALLLEDFDFRYVLSFVINFGRDNDTTAAVSGAILGGFHGFSGIPEDFRQDILDRQKELGIDLEEMAMKLVRKMQQV
ncbi:MAG: ADP-ribosylglycohydrolase family protein [Bacteroidota bacterium]